MGFSLYVLLFVSLFVYFYRLEKHEIDSNKVKYRLKKQEIDSNKGTRELDPWACVFLLLSELFIC